MGEMVQIWKKMVANWEEMTRILGAFWKRGHGGHPAAATAPPPPPPTHLPKNGQNVWKG